MRTATIDGRLHLLLGAGAIDVHTASGGAFAADPDPDAAFADWDRLRDWAHTLDPARATPVDPARIGAPVRRPRQVFGVGVNYRDHAAEAGLAVPDTPVVFGKFSSCLTGPYDPVTLPSAAVDWEVELVVVVGRRAERVAAEDGWAHVAALTVGQDLSERAVQVGAPVMQLSLAKSFPGFGPIGPALVTPDEFEDPDDLRLGCSIDGEVVQNGSTRDLVFPVPELIARLSAHCTLLPGDLIFTGTPAGVGAVRRPPRFLRPGQTLVSWVEGIGELRNPMRARPVNP
ncbi:fumarylacetoacetate hydrolase family protein [Embleya scabrispora]|uniref:fumarylacetoacetate hydrolase family protein n=1 Tax=Embleya scabrispora TaxID=159449 RepID=UPI00035E648F|nr:fumarylacetoacetate hydrolase family protein [Embleya scabrispora]MYS86767.1 fumarylacetoacetate hydrolase [Streptomyces sp. SID5474]